MGLAYRLKRHFSVDTNEALSSLTTNAPWPFISVAVFFSGVGNARFGARGVKGSDTDLGHLAF